jgi:pimeloyl-ACP methyl ester carboxylesterase
MGRATKPHDPESYKPECNVADIISVLTDLDIPRAHFFGYSMGAWIAFAMAQHAPDHVHAFIIGGGSPYPSAARPEALQQHQRAQLDSLAASGVEAIPAIWGVPLPPPLKARLLTNDVQALIAVRTQRVVSPGFAAILPADDDAGAGVCRRGRPSAPQKQRMCHPDAERHVLLAPRSRPRRYLFSQRPGAAACHPIFADGEPVSFGARQGRERAACGASCEGR